MSPWTEKYRPKKLEEIKGQTEAVQKTDRWAGFVLQVTKAFCRLSLKAHRPEMCGAMAGQASRQVNYRLTMVIILTARSFVNRQLCKLVLG